MKLKPEDFGFIPSYSKSKGSEIPFSLQRVRLNSQGYTSQGRYFGVGVPLYEADPKDFNGETITFRAPSPSLAKLGLKTALLAMKAEYPRGGGLDNQTAWDYVAAKIRRDGISIGTAMDKTFR